jgi:cell division protein FtsN
MARDYKHRVESASYKKSRQRKNPPKKLWRWLVAGVLVLAFVYGLNLIKQLVPELVSPKIEVVTAPVDDKTKKEIPINSKPVSTPEPKEAQKVEPVAPEEPRYDFYTILPQAETVIPDYEIKTRVREELVGKTKTAKYTMQAGSFRDSSEADRHTAKLALLGIQAHVEKAKVGNLTWFRVKIGPYDNPSSVATIKDLLQKNGIGVVVTETGQ